MPIRPDDDLPYLRHSSLIPGRRLGPGPFPTSPDLVHAYVAVTADTNPIYSDVTAARRAGFSAPILPPGLCGVWARRSYLAAHRMQPGGVMAGQDIALFAPVLVGSTLMVGAEVLEADPGDPRRAVALLCSARDGNGDLTAQVRIDARWPAEDAT